MLLRHITSLEIAGIDPRRDGEASVWAGSWPDVRDGAYRALLIAGVRMTFAVR